MHNYVHLNVQYVHLKVCFIYIYIFLYRPTGFLVNENRILPFSCPSQLKQSGCYLFFLKFIMVWTWTVKELWEITATSAESWALGSVVNSRTQAMTFCFLIESENTFLVNECLIYFYDQSIDMCVSLMPVYLSIFGYGSLLSFLSLFPLPSFGIIMFYYSLLTAVLKFCLYLFIFNFSDCLVSEFSIE